MVMSHLPKSGSTFDCAKAPLRTALSFEFEAFWRTLPKDRLVPCRDAFRPERAQRFLRHLVLCDVQLGDQLSICLRLTGSEFDSRVQENLRGQDYLQFVPETLRAGLVESVREIIQRPCGLWQVNSVHYQRGFAQNLEITVFPLAAEADGKHKLLVMTQSVDGLVTSRSTENKALSPDTATTYQYIDLGAGVPAN